MKYYLAHHGIQNQHWGVRHGPPYPLDSNASKQAKRKSASKSSYDKLYGDKKGSTSHTGSLFKASNKTKIDNPNYILAKKETLLKKIKNKTISGEELVELNDIIDTENKLNKSMNDATRDEASKNFDISKADYEKYMAMEQKAKAIDRSINIASSVFIAAQNLGIAYNKITGSTIGEDIRKRAAIKTSEKKINTVNDRSKEFKKAEEKINQVKDIPLKTITTVPKNAQKISPYGAKLDQSFDMSYYDTRNIKNTTSDIRDRDRLPSYIKNKKVSPYGALIAKHSKIIYKDYLAHHGVQNQHWGVRHGPPYPLDSNASKQAKRKSASKSSYNKLYGDKKGHAGSIIAPTIAIGTNAAYIAGKAIKNKIDKRKNIKSISNQITNVKLLESRLKDISSELKPMDLKSSYISLKKVPSSYEDKIKDIKNINKISKSSPEKFNETTENCCNCATAYILRQAGYDVKAKPFTRESVKYNTDTSFGLTALSNSIPYTIRKDGEIANTKQIHNIFNKTNTNIAYATLQGHCFILERNNGKLSTIDPQDPKSFINGWDEEYIKKVSTWSGSDLTVIPVDINKLKSGQGVKYYDKFVTARY